MGLIFVYSFNKKNMAFFRVYGKVDDITVVGSKQEDTEPEIVVSQNKENGVDFSLLNVSLETNPLDRKCDIRVSIESRPIQIVYDAVSMICHVEIVFILSLSSI